MPIFFEQCGSGVKASRGMKTFVANLTRTLGEESKVPHRMHDLLDDGVVWLGVHFGKTPELYKDEDY
jgi:hypothetical protein